VHLACKAVLEALTELSLAEEDAPEYANSSGQSAFTEKDVIAELRSLIVTVSTILNICIKYYD